VAREVIEQYRAWPVVVIEPSLILAASLVQERHPLSFRDALIIQAAVVSGAGTLLTEDLSAGRVIEGVRVVDPFAASARGFHER
jgi:predicted nucleic acid-binding protein